MTKVVRKVSRHFYELRQYYRFLEFKLQQLFYKCYKNLNDAPHHTKISMLEDTEVNITSLNHQVSFTSSEDRTLAK